MCCQLFDIRRQYVHKEDSKGYAFGIDTEITDHECEETGSYTEDDLAPSCCGGGNVIGSHEDRSDKKSTRKYHGKSSHCIKAFHKEREREYCSNENYGNVPGNDATDQEVCKADEKSESAGFTDSSSGSSEEEIDELG